MSEAIAISNDWQMTPLKEVLTKSDEWIDLKPDQKYQQVTVRMWGQGVVKRGEVTGVEVASKRMLVVHPQQFIVSRIDARHGASGLIPDALDGAIVTNDFPVFTPNPSKILPKFLFWMSKTHNFVDLCIAASEGTTNRVRLKEDRFLAMQIPLPSLEVQRRVVARIEELVAKVEEARGLRSEAIEEASVFIRSASSYVFDARKAEFSNCPIGEIISFRNELIRPIDGETGSLRFIGLQHIESHTGKRIGEDRLLAEELTGRKFKFSSGEIVYGYLRPYLNKVWVADCEGVCSVDQYVIQPKSELVDIWYLAHFMRSQTFLTQAIELTHNLLLPRLRTALLESILIPLPPLSEQRYVISYINSLQAEVDSLKELQSETEAELNALLPSILDKAFNGEL
jgi:type I restriction enzyme S subunit